MFSAPYGDITSSPSQELLHWVMHSLAREQALAFCQVLTAIPAIIPPSLSVSLLTMLEKLPVGIEMMPQ